MKHLFTLSIFGLIALAFWGLQGYENEKAVNVTDEADPHFVDLFMRDFTLTSMDEKGNPSYKLQASYFEHYKDNTSSLLEKPIIHFLQNNNRWVISAKTGEIDNDQKQITLHDEVVMQQQETDFPVQVKTNYMEIDTDKQIAISNQKVNISHRQLKLQSEGMILNNTTGELELLASVKARYIQANE